MSREKIIYYPVMLEMKSKALHLKTQIWERLRENFTQDISKANVILVAGWDWFLLDSVRQYHWQNKIFFWVNCGTLWFLMNNIESIDELPEYLDQIEHIDEQLIETTIQTTDSKEHKKYSINDIVIWNNLWDMINFELKTKTHKYQIKWTGLIISTSIWSTWYWLNWWGPLLPLRWNIWWIMWMFARPFKYDTIEAQTIEIIPNSRNPVNIWVDWNSWFLERVEKIRLSPSWKFFKLWVQNSTNFETKRVKLCSEKLWSSNSKQTI